MVYLNEVRIGNWVYNSSSCRDGQVDISILDRINQCQNVLFIDNEFEGIPLFEDILTRSGFDPLDQDGEYLGCVFQFQLSINGKSTRFTLHKDIHRDEYEFEHYFDESSKIRPHEPIRYVHQLQNLFFALYGMELNIVL